MSRFVVIAAALAAAGCGLTESEALPSAPSACAALAPGLDTIGAFERAELVVHARALESYFVDACHRALVLEVAEVLKGELPSPLLAIVRIAPGAVDPTGGGEWVFHLEREPSVPEAFRPVSDVTGVVPY